MIKYLARSWRVCHLRRPLCLGRKVRLAKIPIRSIIFFPPLLLAGKPGEWSSFYTEDKTPNEGLNSVSSLQKLKLLELVRKLIENGKIEEAEQILQNAMENAKRSHNLEWTNILLLILAKLAYNNKDYKMAEKHYIELNNNFNRPQEQNQNMIKKLKIHTSFDLAKIYEVTNNYEKAEKLYKHCLSQIQVMNVGSKDYPWATSVLERILDSYSLFLADRKRLEEALQHRNMAYSLVKVTHGDESEKACYSLNEMGRLSALLGDDENAMNHLAKALRIGKKLQIEKKSLCAIYVNSGHLLMKKRMFSKAKEYCSEAKRLASTNNDPHGKSQADVCLEQIDRIRASR